MCVEFRARNDTTAGQFSELNIVEATSKSDLAFAMALGLAAMYSTVAGRVDGKADLYHQSKISNTQRSLVVKGVSRNVERSGVNWRLTGEARAALARGGVREFDAICGQMFASAVRDGAEVWGVINFSSASQEQVDSVSAFVKGEGVNWTARGDLAATVRSKFGNTQMEVRFTRSGGAGEPLASGWDEMVKAASDIPRIARANPVPLTFTLMSYDPYVQPILDSIGGADSTYPFSTLEDLEPLRADLGAFASLIEDAAYVIQHPEQYALDRGITERDVDEVRRKALALFNEVGRAADECLTGTADACTSPFGGTAADSAFALRKRLPLRIRTAQGFERWWSVADVRDALEHDLRVFAARTCAAPAAEYCVRSSVEPVPEPRDPTVVNPALGKDWQYLELSGYSNSCATTSDNTPQDAVGRDAVIWACSNRWNQMFEVNANGALVTNHCFSGCGLDRGGRQKEWRERKADSRLCLTANWQPLVLQPCDESGQTYSMQEWRFRSP